MPRGTLYPPVRYLSSSFPSLHLLSRLVIAVRPFSSAMYSISASTDDCSLRNGADRMELEAAEALAGLAQATAMTTRESSESGTSKWGSKGKRARSGCQVKSESPHVDSPDLALNSSNYQVTMEYDQAEEQDIYEGFKKVKVKQQAKLLSPDLTCEASTAAFGGTRSRKNLTEAEKEEKRLRRVLANRESARQTIRRRQALHEELSRKASVLTTENVDLKREKELALEKLQSLKNANELLKTQMIQSVNPVREEDFLQGVQNVKPKVEDNFLQMTMNIKSELDDNLDLKLAHPNISTPKDKSKIYCNNTRTEHSQLTPSVLPPVVQSLNLNQLASVPRIPMFASSLNSSDKKPYTVNPPISPVYILPYPWFVPIPYRREGEVQCDSSAVEIGNYTTANGSVSSNSGTVENPDLTLTLKAEADVSDVKDNGGSHCLVPQTNKESAFFFPIKITEHTVAAAEARKRRKELTRFKNFTGRHYRLPC